MSDRDGIAIVGMAARLPGAPDVGAYWRNLRAGVESITRFGTDALVAAGVPEHLARHPDYVPVRGVIDGVDLFDRALFGMGPAEAAGTDPQHRLFLQTSAAALDDAAIDPQRFDGWIGVFAGSNVVNPALPDPEASEVSALLGYTNDFLATRVAYKLGLRGPAITVQTACSTSLVAVHQAAQSLLGFECDAALAGGSSIWMPQPIGHLYEEGSINSRDGRCRPFDADASGTVGGNGVGVVVLRRLEDALRDGDPVIAVIRGSAINNDGSDKIGYVAPSVVGQRDVIQLALAQAGVDPGDVSYVEAHGTGTRVGDPVEVTALTAAFRDGTDEVGYCLLGAVKSNIGHLGPASGVAGLIKTALQLRHRTVVPTLHYERPNPELKLVTSPFRIADRTEPLPQEGPVLAGLSSFGMGGTNAHVVLESAPTRPARRPGGGTKVFSLSAAAPEALRRMRTELADVVEAGATALDDVALTLATGRRRFPHRAAVVAAEPGELAAALRAEQTPATASATDQVAFLFPGQGALTSGFGTAAHRLLPVFREEFDGIAALAGDRFGVDLGAVLRQDVDPAWLRDTTNQQLGLFAIGYALARQFQEFGIEPAAMLGHSVGEYVAATVSGLWTAPDALALIHERGQALRETPPGRMLAVAGTPEEVAAHLTPEIALAVEGPRYSVLAGTPEAIEALRAAGVGERVLDTEHAFHSPLVRPAAERVGRAVAATANGTPTLPFLSNLTGTWADPARLTEPDYWVDHLCGTVRLAGAFDTLLSGSCQVFLELGPGRSMSRMARGHADWRSEHLAIPLTGGAQDDPEVALTTAFARLWERGFEAAAESLLSGSDAVRVSLPPYSFEPTECVTRTAAPRVELRVVQADEPLPDALRTIWCDILGTVNALPEHDFYTQGGESLMSIQLLGRIRDRLGVTIPVTAFSERPTFGRLLELAEANAPASQTRPDSPNLLVLRETGDRQPLFLAPPAAGTSLVYRGLAAALGPDQPCYGLESPGLHDGAVPLRRFADIAAHHVDLVRQVQPHGPYLLGGWSVGAMVAHEMARQLIEQGETVTRLIGIDGCVIDTKGWPMAADPGFLASALRLLRDTENGVGPVAADLAGVGDTMNLLGVYRANLRAMLRYRPRPLPVDLLAYPANQHPDHAGRLRRRVRRLYRDTTIVPMPGDHWTILGEHLDTLVAHLGGELAERDGDVQAA